MTHPPEQVGTATRDGAVDPRPDDYLGPSNAGEPGELSNPHGPHVISPGLPDEWPTYSAWRQLGCCGDFGQRINGFLYAATAD